jgi:flagellin
MVALQTLQNINMQLDQTNNRISTGLKVNTAADNPAYWAIATTLKSDNNALSAVSDSLGVAASAATATYTGINSAKNVLDQIKSQLTTATGDVDRSKVQLQISALQQQLKTIADQAAISGDNWLSTGSSTNFTRSIVSSVSRDSNNNLQVGSIDVDITNMRLYGNGTSQFGILDKTIDLNTYTATSGTASTVQSTPVALASADDAITFSVSQNGAPGRTVTINQTTLTEAGLANNSIQSNADLKAVYTQAFKDAGVTGMDVAVDSSGNVNFSSADTFTVGPATDVGTDTIDVTTLGLTSGSNMTTSSASANAGSVATIDVSTATTAQVESYLKVVDAALSQVTDAGTQIGTVQNRISSQQTFVKAIMDANTNAVGSLVNADMETESTKLKALQTQQQLAIQSLGIANSTTQNILQLFR